MGASEASEVRIDRVDVVDLPVLMPMLRAYCDFDEVDPRDDRLVALCRALIEDPTEGEQAIARDGEGRPLGFATVFWTWQTLDAARIGVLNDLYVVESERGGGLLVGALLEGELRDAILELYPREHRFLLEGDQRERRLRDCLRP